MFGKWCEVTSCNGIIDLYQARKNKAHFTFWAIVMVMMTGASIYFTFRTLQLYIETPTVTNVGLVRQPRLKLPNILVCYNGGLNVTSLKQLNFDEEFNEIINYNLRNDYKRNSSHIKEQFDKHLQLHDLQMNDFLRIHGYSCENLVKNFRLSDLSQINCDSSFGITNTYGNCYQFYDVGFQAYPDVEYGLRITLEAPNDSFAAIYPEKASRMLLSSSFAIYLFEKKNNNFPSQSIIIPSSSLVSIVLTSKRYVRSIDCNANNDISSDGCFFKCWLEDYKQNCNCTYLARIPFDSNETDICNLFETCYIGSSDYQDMCLSKCWPPCDEVIFEGSISSSFYSNVRNDYFSDVFIGYSSMQYTQIDIVNAFTIDMAIANVGGQSGLWLGLSIVSVIQAMYYIVIAISRRLTTVSTNNENQCQSMTF